MRNGLKQMDDQLTRERASAAKDAPQPTPQFRRRAWVDFQRALDPLAPPKPLKQPRLH